MRPIIILVFLIFSITSPAQDSAGLSKFLTKTIYPLGNGYYRGEQKLKFREVKDLFKNYPNTAAEMKVYNKNATVSALLELGGLAAGIVGLSIYNQHKKASNALLSVGVTMQLVSLPFSISARNHFQRAMRLYNKNVMSF